MREAEIIIDTAAARKGRLFTFNRSKETIPSLLWRISDYLDWEAGGKLKDTSKRTKLRAIAAKMGLPPGSGGHARELELDPDTVHRLMLMFVYVAYLGRPVEDFLDDYDSQYAKETTIDVKANPVPC